MIQKIESGAADNNNNNNNKQTHTHIELCVTKIQRHIILSVQKDPYCDESRVVMKHHKYTRFRYAKGRPAEVSCYMTCHHNTTWHSSILLGHAYGVSRCVLSCLLHMMGTRLQFTMFNSML